MRGSPALQLFAEEALTYVERAWELVHTASAVFDQPCMQLGIRTYHLSLERESTLELGHQLPPLAADIFFTSFHIV